MYKVQLTQLLLSVSILTICLSSCNPDKYSDLEVAPHEAEFAFPLFQTSFKIGDLMQQTLNDTLDGDTLLVDAAGNMTLIYSGDVVEKKATDLFEFFDVFSGAAPIFLPDTLYYVPYDTSANSALANVDIYRADLRKGQITVLGQNTFSQNVTGTLHVPQLTKNGVAYKENFVGLPNSFIISATRDLTGYRLTSTNDSLFFRYEAYLPNGDRVVFPADKFGALIQSVEFSYLEGYWGNEVYPLALDTIPIDINQTNFSGGEIRIKDPKVSMRVFNSYGFPTRGNIKHLEFEGSDGVFRRLESPQITNNYIDFQYPSLAGGEVGQTKSDVVVFDNTNSNIKDIFNSQPVSLVYEVEGIANANSDPSIIGFLTDSSNVRLNVLVELPLEGAVKNFGSESEVAIDFSDLTAGSSAEITEAEFKLVTDNQMPVAINGQFYFLDAAGVVTDSLFDAHTEIMAAADVDQNGVPLGPKEKITFATLSGQRFTNIENAKRMKMQLSFTTSSGGSKDVKILFDQISELRMGVIVKVKQD